MLIVFDVIIIVFLLLKNFVEKFLNWVDLRILFVLRSGKKRFDKC